MPSYAGSNDPQPPRWPDSAQVVGMAVAAFTIPALAAGLLLGAWAYDCLNRWLPPLPWW